MTAFFISPDDEYVAQSKSPKAVGQMKLSSLGFHMNMSDDELAAVCAKAKQIRDLYTKWEEFYRDIDLRKKRSMGFKAAVMALDLNVAAQAMGTTPEKIAGVMSMYAASEDTRIKELEELWKAGVLPDRAVLGDPSRDIVEEEPIPPLPPIDPEDPVDSEPTG